MTKVQNAVLFTCVCCVINNKYETNEYECNSNQYVTRYHSQLNVLVKTKLSANQMLFST